jgi:hypothetical protein
MDAPEVNTITDIFLSPPSPNALRNRKRSHDDTQAASNKEDADLQHAPLFKRARKEAQRLDTPRLTKKDSKVKKHWGAMPHPINHAMPALGDHLPRHALWPTPTATGTGSIIETAESITPVVLRSVSTQPVRPRKPAAVRPTREELSRGPNGSCCESCARFWAAKAARGTVNTTTTNFAKSPGTPAKSNKRRLDLTEPTGPRKRTAMCPQKPEMVAKVAYSQC